MHLFRGCDVGSGSLFVIGTTLVLVGFLWHPSGDGAPLVNCIFLGAASLLIGAWRYFTE